MKIKFVVFITAFGFLLTASERTARADGASKPAAQKPAATAQAQNPAAMGTPRLRLRIVVDQGKWEEIRSEYWILPNDVREGIQAQLLDKMQKSGAFIVMEREAGARRQQSEEDAIDAIKRGSLPPGAVTPPPRQQRTAGNYIITPTVIGFTATGGSSNGLRTRGLGGLRLPGILGAGQSKQESSVTLNIRISDAQTSEIIDTQTAVGKCEAKSTGFTFVLTGADFTSEQFQKSPAGRAVDLALDDAVAKVIARLSKEPWTALVAAQDKKTNRVIINAGSLSGVEVGQTFDVYRAGQDILDPATGEPISHGDEVKVGRIKVARVEPKAAYADILDGHDFQPSDIVKALP